MQQKSHGIILQDWSNPLVRGSIHVYPEITKTVSESWQAAKAVEEVDLDALSPMWADWKNAKHRHFYVNELSQLKDKTFFLPIKWVVYEKAEHAEGYCVTQDQVSLNPPNPLRVATAELRIIAGKFLD